MTCNDNSVGRIKGVLIETGVLAISVCCIYILENLVPSFERGFFCGDQSLMLPYRENTITSQMLQWVGILTPVLTILLVEWWYLRNEQDETYWSGIRLPVWLRGFYSTAASFGIGLCFVELSTTIAKKTIGRLRPHFFALCVPSVNCSEETWRDRYVQPADYTCTGSAGGSQLVDMRKSFLSGHSSWAAYTMLFAVLYMERRNFTGSHTFRLGLQFVLLMMGWFTALSRVSDYKHHWSDVLAGYTLGTVAAIVMCLYCTKLIERKIRPATSQQLNDVTTKH